MICTVWIYCNTQENLGSKFCSIFSSTAAVTSRVLICGDGGNSLLLIRKPLFWLSLRHFLAPNSSSRLTLEGLKALSKQTWLLIRGSDMWTALLGRQGGQVEMLVPCQSLEPFNTPSPAGWFCGWGAALLKTCVAVTVPGRLDIFFSNARIHEIKHLDYSSCF